MIRLKGYLLGKLFNAVSAHSHAVFLSRNGKRVSNKREILAYIGDKRISW